MSGCRHQNISKINRRHIEFFGPPGAGKSAVHKLVTDRQEFYGGTQQDAVERYISKNFGKKYRSLYIAIPNILCSQIDDKIIEPRIRQRTFADFIVNNPYYMDFLKEIICEADHEPKRLFRACKVAAERYQIALETINDQEHLCLDESFFQRYLSVISRMGVYDEFLKKLGSATPLPDTLVYIDAPIDVCINRQQRRGRFTVSEDWRSQNPIEEQRRLSDICNLIVNSTSNEVKVVRVVNDGCLQETVDSVLAALN
jgi:dephospho-CoA kinase